MPLEKVDRFTVAFSIFSDSGRTVQHKYTGLNDLEVYQQLNSISKVIIDLVRAESTDMFTIRLWKEDD